MVARELNLSLAMLIQNGIEEYIKNHAGELSPSTPQKHFLQTFRAINKSKGGGDNGDN